MSASELLRAAEVAEQKGRPESARLLREMAAKLGATPAAPAAPTPTVAPAAVPARTQTMYAPDDTGFSPPPGAPLSSDSIATRRARIQGAEFMEDLRAGRLDPEVRERQRQYREALVERPRFGGRPFENIEAGAVVYAPESPVEPDIAPVEMDDQQVAMELSLPRGASYMRRAAPTDARVYMERLQGPRPDGSGGNIIRPPEQRGEDIDLERQFAATSAAVQALQDKETAALMGRTKYTPQYAEQSLLERINPLSQRRLVTPGEQATRQLEDQFIMQAGMSEETARAAARAGTRDVGEQRLTTQGDPVTTGERNPFFYGLAAAFTPWALLPTFRESRLRVTKKVDPSDPTRQLYIEQYRDPDTGDLRAPKWWERLSEAVSRQVYAPDVSENIRRQQAFARQTLASELIESGMQADEARRLVIETVRDENRARRNKVIDIATRAIPGFEREDERLDAVQEPLMRGLLSTTKTDSELGLLQETPVAQLLRNAGVFPTLVNTALFELLPFTYEMDPETGEPYDKNDPAYRIDQLLRQGLRLRGFTEDEIERRRTGGFRLPSSAATTGVGASGPEGPFMPVPFQGATRTRPHAMDPTGMRAARQTGGIVAKFAEALRSGRFLGDELMSIPGYVAEFPVEPAEVQPGYGVLSERYDAMENGTPTAPFWQGVVYEGVYGIGPVPAARAAARTAIGGTETLARGAKEALRFRAPKAAKAADVVEKLAYAAGDPVQAAKTSKSIRIAQELAEMGDVDAARISEIELTKGLNNAQRVAAEAIGEEVLAPYILQARLEAGPATVSVGMANDLAANSKAARTILEDVGVLNGPRDRLLTQSEIAALRKQLNQHSASAWRVAISDIMLNNKISARQKARDIIALLEDEGVVVSALPGGPDLRRASNASDAAAPSLLESALGQMEGLNSAIPVMGNLPVMTTLHDLGKQAVMGARSGGDVQFGGRAGRVVNRRMGADKVTQDRILRTPEELLRATSAAGGRVVESALENIVPKNMTVVSNSLMVPTNKLTEEVFEAVERSMTALQPTVRNGPKIGGTVSQLYYFSPDAADEFIRSQGKANIERSELMSGMLLRMQSGKPLTGAEARIVEDSLLTQAFRDAMGSEAREIMFAGRQLERAEEPLVEVGLDVRPEKRVPRTVPGSGQVIPGRLTEAVSDLKLVAKEAGGAALGRALNRGAKRNAQDADEIATNFPTQVDADLPRVLQRVKSEIASIGDNIRVEIRDAATGAKNPEAAFNQVIQKRIERQMIEITQTIDKRAEELAKTFGMTPEQAYLYLTYQSPSATARRGLGQELFAGNIPPNIRQLAIQREQAQLMMNAWRDVLQDFFGKDLYDSFMTDGLLRNLVAVPNVDPNFIESAADVVPFTTRNLQDMIDALRIRNPKLKGRGLSKAPFVEAGGVETRDGVFPAMLSWAMGADARVVKERSLRELAETNPDLFVNVMPSIVGRTPQRVQGEARLILDNRAGALDVLNEIIEAPTSVRGKGSPLRGRENSVRFSMPITDSRGQNKVNGLGQIEAGESVYVQELDNLARRAGLAMSARTRQQIAEQVFEQTMMNNRSVPDLEELLGNIETNANLDLSAFETQATTNAIKSIMRGLGEDFALARADLDNLPPGTPPIPSLPEMIEGGMAPDDVFRMLRYALGNDDDATLLQHIAYARHSGAPDDVIIAGLRRNIIDRAYTTFVQPMVEDMRSVRSSMGYKPNVTKNDLFNLQRELELADPTSVRLGLFGQQWSDTLKELQAASDSGKLAQNVENLRRRDAAAKAVDEDIPLAERQAARTEVAIEAVRSFLVTRRRIAASGALAGGAPIPLPLGRYIVPNAVTAPLIAMSTVGPVNAVRMLKGPGYASQLADVEGQLANIINKPLTQARSTPNPSEYRFTSKTGKRWTQGEIDEAIKRNNILISRGQMEFNDAFIADVLRDAKLLIDATPAPAMRQHLRQLDPRRTSFFQYVANATDKAFRENMFVSALKQGMTEEQAARMARAVVLDYGAVPDKVKNGFNRYILFLSFRFANYMESVRGMARDPNTFMRSLNALDNSQTQSDLALTGPDYVRMRPILSKIYDFDEGAGSALFGPSVPFGEAYADMYRFATWAAQAGARNNNFVGAAAGQIEEENLIPLLSLAISAYKIKGNLSDTGSKVPSEWVAYAMGTPNNFVWSMMREHVKPVPKDREAGGRVRAMDPMYPQEGFQEYQWKSKNAELAFKAALMTFAYMGIERTRADYTKLGMTYGVDEFLDPARFGLAPTLGYATGVTTPINLESIEKQSRRALREQEKTAREQARD